MDDIDPLDISAGCLNGCLVCLPFWLAILGAIIYMVLR